jgi:preprotein translocase subunit SecE
MAQTSAKTVKPNVWVRFRRYLNDVMAEMRRVTWPKRDEVMNSSVIVLVTLAIFLVLIFALDQASTVIIRWLAGLVA